MTVEEALQALFGDDARDLSADGYLEAISRLRQCDSRLAARVEKALRPVLNEVFPKRAVLWHETSRGTEHRLALLDVNPHFAEDIVTIRKAFQVPEIGIGRVDRRAYESPRDNSAEESPDLEVLNLASLWLRAHRRSANGEPVDSLSDGLPSVLLAGALSSGKYDLGEVATVPWLRNPPSFGRDCRWIGGLESPLHRAVSSVLERHRLPHHICGKIEMFSLTGIPKVLQELRGLQVDLARGSTDAGGGGRLKIEVDGLDEFTLREEGLSIWDTVVRPRQEELHGQRGQRPHGRIAPEVERLSRGVVLYKIWIRSGDINKSLDELASLHCVDDLDVEIARRVLADLANLLQPKVSRE